MSNVKWAVLVVSKDENGKFSPWFVYQDLDTILEAEFLRLRGIKEGIFEIQNLQVIQYEV